MKICPYMYASVLRFADLENNFPFWAASHYIRLEDEDEGESVDRMEKEIGSDEETARAEKIMELIVCKGEKCGRFYSCNNLHGGTTCRA